MTIFGLKPRGTHLEKCQFFDCLNFLFYSLHRRFFVLEYRKKPFPGLYCLKKRVLKMAIFGRKPWVNPFEKNFNFSSFSKEKVEKLAFLDQNDGLTPLEKCQLFDFLNFLFLQPRKAFFVLEYRKRYFPCLYCQKKKV